MASQPVQAVLYRILGNDLPPRYSSGQTLANLHFTLEHEPELPGLEKRWLLNRIVCPDTLAALQEAIRAAGQRFDVIPFEEEAYLRVWTDLGATPPECHPWSESFEQLPRLMQLRISDYIGRAKNQYLMNNNGARNCAIELGLAAAEWVLPWDGGCFLPAWAWADLQVAMADSQLHYLCVPMHRLANNAAMPSRADRDEVQWDEPQLGFSRRARLRFDENLRYGSMPKALLLRRIGLPGPWQQSEEGWLPWEHPELSPAMDAGAHQLTSLVLRLSGDQHDARHTDLHGLWGLRFAGILRFIRTVDIQIMRCQLEKQLIFEVSQCSDGWVQVVEHVSESISPPPYRCAQQLTDGLLNLSLNYTQSTDLKALGYMIAVVRSTCLDPATAISFSGLPLTVVAQLEGLIKLRDAIALLRQAGLLSMNELEGLRSWWEDLLAWLLNGSQAFLQRYPSGPLPIRYHLALLVVGIELKHATVCCQVLDNLPALLTKLRQADEPAWILIQEACIHLGRDIKSLKACNACVDVPT